MVVEPMSATLAAIQTARTANEARKYVDKYAKKHSLSREEAIQQLSREAQRKGLKQAHRLVRDYKAHLDWRRSHPVKGVIVTGLDPTGVFGGTLRHGRRWLKKTF